MRPESRPSVQRRRPAVWLGIALVLLTIAVYAPALSAGFIWDDDSYVTQNPTLRSAAGLAQIWFKPGATPQYYPLVFTSFWVEYHLWGLHPAGYHAVNVVLHAAVCLLLWRVLRGLGLHSAWLAAAVFAIHPVHVESVAWVTERKNVLSGVFYMLSLLLALRYLGLDEVRPERAGRRWLYPVAVAAFVAALLSKTVACTLPVAVWLLVWWKRGRLDRRTIVSMAPLIVIGAAGGAMTAWMEMFNLAGSGRGAIGAEWEYSFVDRGLIAGRAVAYYASKCLWPVGLCFNYPRWQVSSAVAWQYLYPIGVLLVLACLWLARHRIGRGPVVAALFFVATLVPALGFVNVYPFRFSFVADHFQYLASLGVIVPVIELLGRAAERMHVSQPRVRLAGGLALLATLGVVTARQAVAYRSAESLWRDTIAKNPDSWLAQAGLARIWLDRGDSGAAIELLSDALRRKPDDPHLQGLLGNALLDAGRPVEALAPLREALRLNEHLAPTRFNLAIALAATGDAEGAIGQYERLVQLFPGYSEAWNNLADLYARRGRGDEALAILERVAREQPNYVRGRLHLGRLLCDRGRGGEALPHLLFAVAAHPNAPVVHYEIGRAFEQTGDFAKAMRAYQATLELEPGNAPARARLDDLRKRFTTPTQTRG